MDKNRAVRITYSLLRVVSGLLFMQAGGLILFGWFGGMPGGDWSVDALLQRRRAIEPGMMPAAS